MVYFRLDHVFFELNYSVHTKNKWLTPYAQISVGYARSNATEPDNVNLSPAYTPLPRLEDNFLMYEVFAGVSLKIFPVVDLRPVELGVGHMNRIGSGNGSSSVGVETIGASIVFHMP